MALFIAILVVQYKGAEWEQPVRTALYNLLSDSVPVYSQEIVDEQGIPFVDYKTLNGITPGKQYNPTIVCNYAINYYQSFQSTADSSLLTKFFNCADWLVQHMADTNGQSFFIFNWQQPWYDSVGVPFTSGMTSGLAIKVFTYASKLRPSGNYLVHARSLLRGFYLPINKGGFTYMHDDGWWYEEIADPSMHTPRILDGHIFAISGVYEYLRRTNDDSARLVFDKGIKALKNRLPDYDIGNGWSYYDAYRAPADRKYHTILTRQMKELHDITGDTFFLSYFDKWNKPLQRSYLRTIVEDRNTSGLILLFITWICCFILVKLPVEVAMARKA